MQMDIQSFTRLGLAATGAAQTILLQTSENHPYALASGGFLAMVGSINYLRRESFARSWKKQLAGLDPKKAEDTDIIIKRVVGHIIDAIQFCNDYGSAKITPKEEQAIWEFYHRVGVRMELADIPDNLEQCYTFVKSYTEDDKSAKVTKDGQALTASITKLVDVIMASSYGCPVSSKAIKRVGPVDMLAKIEANELKEE
ncbi:hypothetical protein BG000_004408 [Podila horticola]|nr:hypothetical protein BG000_004408 [Podila horticola]